MGLLISKIFFFFQFDVSKKKISKKFQPPQKVLQNIVSKSGVKFEKKKDITLIL